MGQLKLLEQTKQTGMIVELKKYLIKTEQFSTKL